MRTKLILFTFILCINTSIAQVRVGINTDSPQETLDVDGNIVFRGPIRVGGSDTSPGDCGEPGQYLVGQSDGTAKWTTLNIPKVKKGNYYLYSTFLQDDQKGVIIPEGSAPEGTTVQKGESINDWYIMEGLTMDIEVPEIIPSTEETKALNTISASFQTESMSTEAGGVIAIGLFIDGELELAGSTMIIGGGYANPTQTIYLRSMIEDISGGTHKIQVGAKRLHSTETAPIAVGVNIPEATSISPFMMQSALVLDILSLDVE